MTVLCLLEAQGGSLAKDNWYRGKAQVNPLKTEAKLHPIEQKMNQKKKKRIKYYLLPLLEGIQLFEFYWKFTIAQNCVIAKFNFVLDPILDFHSPVFKKFIFVKVFKGFINFPKVLP